MAYTKDELSQLDDVVYGAITKFYQKVIAPVMATKQDLDEAEERLTNRIDRIAEVTTDTRTNHERRIRKLEDEAGVVPEVRLTL